MGMDVHGKNPKQNKKLSDFPIYYKFSKMDFEEKWGELEKKENKEIKKQYHKEWDEWESSNPGIYFRNNVWWWRPLWDYCYHIADDLISEELWNRGHNNDGAGLNDRDAKLLGNRLLQKIREGHAANYKDKYQQRGENEYEQSYLYHKGITSHTIGSDLTGEPGNHFPKYGKDGSSIAFEYPFDIDNVKAFAEFCIQSGGFEIC